MDEITSKDSADLNEEVSGDINEQISISTETTQAPMSELPIKEDAPKAPKQDISRFAVFVVLILAIVVSGFGTYMVLSSTDGFSISGENHVSPSATAYVGVNIVNNYKPQAKVAVQIENNTR